MLCRAFATGVRSNGGTAILCDDPVDRLLAGAAVFYGVRPHQKPLLDQAIAEGRDYYYIDNAYFDSTREVYFRITRNRLQHTGTGISNGERFNALKIQPKPWRKAGKHILVCPQSDEFLNLFCPDGAQWTARTVERLTQLTKRPIRVRPWQQDKREWYRTLPDDLAESCALVTFSSASAITAMLEGVPAFVTAADCISRPVANTDLHLIIAPRYTADLKPWLNVVADNQFTISEIMTGYAWRFLQAKATEESAV
jgi:hypothetical protein